mmetsp:Transcript_8764/g.18697  ORF Transcript_8764/g.18697 Transcript_8764/m.18697 type:complete len:337 (+) Transcript_8764:201-1211(+)
MLLHHHPASSTPQRSSETRTLKHSTINFRPTSPVSSSWSSGSQLSRTMAPRIPNGAPAAKPAVKATAASGKSSIQPIGRETKVQFRNAAGHRLVGKFVEAAGNPEAVVILCHGYASTKDSALLLRLAQELNKVGLNSLRFDFAGNGESEGPFEFGNYLSEASDLRAAVLFVRDTLKKKVVAVAGHSKGGDVVLLYAATFDDVPFVVNISGRFDMKRGIKERFGEEMLSKVEQLGQVQQQVRTEGGAVIKFMLTKKDLADRLSLDMEAAGRKITISEVLTVHGTADTVIPPEDAQQFARVIRQHQLFLIPGADHNYRTPAHAELAAKKIADYIKSGL